jgi:N12 class adenine-specific DNA methylase
MGKVDLDYMVGLTDMTEEQLIKELDGLIFLNIGDDVRPNAYVAADEYLSGNVREKLASAKAAQATVSDGRYDTNVRALEAVQPKDLEAPEISVRLGATWLPPDVVKQFITQLLTPNWRIENRIDVLYSEHTAEWNIANKSIDGDNIKAFNTYGTRRMNAYWIIENTLNLRDVRIFDTRYDENGKEIRVLNKRETAIAQDKQDLIKEKFAEWIWVNPARRERLCKSYNERFNSVRPRAFDGSHLAFPGMNPEITLGGHQQNAIARNLYGGNTLFGHTVGAGKTFSMIASAMEAKRIGLCNKPMFVVPNNIIGDFAGDFFRLYPAANVLMATAKDFEKKNRRKFCARIATGDYDGIIIGHSQFEKLPMSLERQQIMIENQIADLTLGIADAKRQDGQRFTIKQMEKTRKSLEIKLKKLNDQSRKDDLVTFEELGVDRLFIDEADLFKNLYFITKMRNVAGVAQSDAQKAADLFMKTQYLDEITDRRGVVFATGTPVSNTMAEVYTMQRYLQYDTLRRNGLEHFDCWASTFGETVTSMEITPDGTGFQQKTRFSRFYNLPELMSMFKEVADIQTKDMLNLPTPKVNYHVEVSQPSEMQNEMVAGLGERAERIRRREVNANEDNMLLITNDGRKLALDQRLMNPLLPDFEGSKVNKCVNNVVDIWERTKADRLTQILFCDLSTPKGDGSFSVYEDIRTKLIAKGIPAEEIAFVHEAKNELQKKELFAKVRTGSIRVLLGSSAKCGAGTNIQDKLVGLHDLDCPWRPRDVGRILRTVY